MPRFALLATSALVAIAAISAAHPVAAGALAHPTAPSHPSATFSFVNNKINSGAKPRLTYSTVHLPRRSKIYLQRQFGSRRAWKSVEHLKKPSGTAGTPAVQMGSYAYRIRVLAGKKAVTTSAVHHLYAYGNVAYATLCTETDASCQQGTMQVCDTVFTYVQHIPGTTTYPTYTQILSLGKTSCSQIKIRWAAFDTTSGDASYTKILQSSSDPRKASTPSNTIGTITARLDGGPLIVDGATTDGNDMFLNGSARCYTTSGLR
jgi:hypothetical protein